MTLQLQAFLDAHPPAGDMRKASPDTIERYKSHLPEALLALWTRHGFGHYGNGLIQLIDPDSYRDNLWRWLLLDEPDMSRLPFALSAFGDVFYYRSLSDEGDEDVAVLDPHRSASDVIVWSLEDFFNDWCCDAETISGFLDAPLLGEARASKGALLRDEIYVFVPALRLGGTRSAAHVDRGDARVHLELLLQLALDG